MKIDHVSHSSLSALKVSPQFFIKYKNRELDRDSRSLDLGSAIHSYILEQEKFYDRYIICDVPVIGGMMGTFIEFMVENEEWTPTQKVLCDVELHKICYEKSGFKIPLATVVAKLKLEGNKNYLNFLRQAAGKTVLSEDEFGIVINCTESINVHKTARTLCNTNDLSGGTPELEISWTYKDFPYKIKSIIDNLILDKDKKEVRIVDLKTTAKSVYNFVRSYVSYGYYRQLGIYRLAVHSYLKELGEDPSDYNIFSYIVAVQTTGLFECVVYEPDNTDLSVAVDEFESLLDRLKWHSDHDHWDYPMEYYSNNGIIKIKLSDEAISRIKENS
jgi:hypothetical protein